MYGSIVHFLHRLYGKAKILHNKSAAKNSKEREISLISPCSFQVKSGIYPNENQRLKMITSLYTWILHGYYLEHLQQTPGTTAR